MSKKVLNSQYSGANSLLQFLDFALNNQVIEKQRLNSSLEIGPGDFPVLSNFKETFNQNHNCTFIDKRKLVKINLDYILNDFLTYKFSNTFDLILDGHVLHTLKEKNECYTYIKKIYNLLNENGSFVLETMVTHKNMSFDDHELYFDYNEGLLYKNAKQTRVIFSVNEIESLLKQIGFKIIYLYLPKDFKMIPFDGRESPSVNDPDLLRVICQKVI